jgi:hypothetical protein
VTRPRQLCTRSHTFWCREAADKTHKHVRVGAACASVARTRIAASQIGAVEEARPGRAADRGEMLTS